METQKTKQNNNAAKLKVREAVLADIPALVALSLKVYPDDAFSAEHMHGQITKFPQGQFVVEYEDKIIGHCSTFRIDGDICLKPHTWMEITGGGFASRHDPKGDYLYGMNVTVDPDFRGLRIGNRLYQRRKKLCKDLKLRGIVFGGGLALFLGDAHDPGGGGGGRPD